MNSETDNNWAEEEEHQSISSEILRNEFEDLNLYDEMVEDTQYSRIQQKNRQLRRRNSESMIVGSPYLQDGFQEREDVLNDQQTYGSDSVDDDYFPFNPDFSLFPDLFDNSFQFDERTRWLDLENGRDTRQKSSGSHLSGNGRRKGSSVNGTTSNGNLLSGSGRRKGGSVNGTTFSRSRRSVSPNSSTAGTMTTTTTFNTFEGSTRRWSMDNPKPQSPRRFDQQGILTPADVDEWLDGTTLSEGFVDEFEPTMPLLRSTSVPIKGSQPQGSGLRMKRVASVDRSMGLEFANGMADPLIDELMEGGRVDHTENASNTDTSLEFDEFNLNGRLNPHIFSTSRGGDILVGDDFVMTEDFQISPPQSSNNWLDEEYGGLQPFVSHNGSIHPSHGSTRQSNQFQMMDTLGLDLPAHGKPLMHILRRNNISRHNANGFSNDTTNNAREDAIHRNSKRGSTVPQRLKGIDLHVGQNNMGDLQSLELPGKSPTNTEQHTSIGPTIGSARVEQEDREVKRNRDDLLIFGDNHMDTGMPTTRNDNQWSTSAEMETLEPNVCKKRRMSEGDVGTRADFRLSLDTESVKREWEQVVERDQKEHNRRNSMSSSDDREHSGRKTKATKPAKKEAGGKKKAGRPRKPRKPKKPARERFGYLFERNIFGRKDKE
eukprot:TRINITY_DN8329_c0_g1_i3.p1 TRINITY_DN8329_c0_g1~~TRINITY_DN8329_c0_g1_i3.p1  ORF type:complete len:658 (+),score=150.08 TRINITY_DN8329_c0_g1_i3:1699-3672(+)